MGKSAQTSGEEEAAALTTNVELERYRIKIGLYKVVFGTFIVGLAGVLIPGAIQFWSLHFDDQRKRLEIELQATRQHENYIKDFLNTALDQDIELRIRFAQYFSEVSLPPFKKGWNDLLATIVSTKKTNRKEINNKEHELRTLISSAKDLSPEKQIVKAQLERELEWLYSELGYVAKDRSIVPSPLGNPNLSGSWRIARSVETLRTQINQIAPNRNKALDGTYSAPKLSSVEQNDHEPWVRDESIGVVTAIDITDDPEHGVNCERIAEALRVSKDPRIKYVALNGRMFSSSGDSPWIWRPYTVRPSSNFLHLSVLPNKEHYDSTTPWKVGGIETKTTSENNPIKR